MPKHITVKSKNDIIKFPRTRHIYDLGAATRDDLLLSQSERKDFLSPNVITIEEKVDGANLGLFYDGTAIRAQNRSHWVTEESGTQWQKLGSWITEHEDSLISLLSPANSKILYGEWLCVQHTVKYNALPDYFLAFDLYDVKEAKFYSRERFWNELKDSGIYYVRTIEKSISVKTKEELVALLERQKTLYDTNKGKVEGIYIRKDSGDWLLDRCKLVNKEFVQSVNEDDHWMHKITNYNKVRKDLWLNEEDDYNKEENEIIALEKIKAPQVLIMTGIPGSGKTTFGKRLVDSTSSQPPHKKWKLISQDDFGKTKTKGNDFIDAVDAAIRNVKSGKLAHLAIDKCNPKRQDREMFLKLCKGLQCTILFFDVPSDICLQRALERNDHPTLPNDRVRKAIGNFTKIFERPEHSHTKDEPFTVIPPKSVSNESESDASIVTIHNDAEFNAYFECLEF